MVFDGSGANNAERLKAYVDNNSSMQQQTLSFSGTISSFTPDLSSVPFEIGRDRLQFFNGLIDEVTIYNRALSVDEITKNYKHQKGKHKND